MQDRIKNCIDQAMRARQKALSSGDSEQKRGWMLMAGVWDEMANEYRVMAAEVESVKRAEARWSASQGNVVSLHPDKDPEAL